MKVFITYRTVNSRFARLIAGWLQHNDISVWFAEEQIHLRNQTDDDKIRKQLQLAIASCTHVLMITNLDYLDAPWCQLEANAISDRQAKKKIPIIEICLPRELQVRETYEFLKDPDVGCVEHKSLEEWPDLSRIEDEMRRCNWIGHSKTKNFEATSDEDVAEAIPTPWGEKIPIRGWRLGDEKPPLKISSETSALDAYAFRRSKPFPIHLSVAFGRYVTRDVARPSFGNSSDREIRNWAIQRASGIVRQDERDAVYYGYPIRTESDTTAVHIDFVCDHAHLSLTGKLKKLHPCLGSVWFRVFFLTFYDRLVERDIEALITFYVYGGRKRLNCTMPLIEAFVKDLDMAFQDRFGPNRVDSVTTRKSEHESSRIFALPVKDDTSRLTYRIRQIVHWFTGSGF